MKNWNRQKIVFLRIQIFHQGDSKDRPQNGLYTIVELIFFECTTALRVWLQFDGENMLLQSVCLPDGGPKND